jgi:carotenoid cleavage dioxygenase-like enzyme
MRFLACSQGAHAVTHETVPGGAPFVEEAFLHRFVLDTASGRVVESAPLSAVASDFPVVHPAAVGRPTRFAFAAGVASGGHDPITLFDSLVKHDLASGDVVRRQLPPGVLCGDVAFAPRVPGSAAAGDDDGHILLLTHVLAEERAELLVLDARDILAPPLATVHVPVRVPFGFHVDWVPGPIAGW